MKRFVSVLLVVVMCITSVPITVNSQRDISKEEILAQELKDLGLFRGVSETDFDLDRAPSRVEALVMLIRVLGKESEVTGDTWKHPFTDVPGWADNYVGYAYSKGLTNGQSATQFGTGDANAAMYLTFVLRALGYSDTNGKDFNWNDPYPLSRETGILTDGVNIEQFWRSDVVLVSHAALSAYINGLQQTLAQKLISAGVFTQSKFDSVYNKGTTVQKPTQNGELTSEEIYAKCSPAVFYIELYDKNDEAIASGSGFFIDDKGTAVTNYHVIEDAYSALIQLSDTEAIHEVLGVYDYNAEEDWAIIKIDCSGNKYLNVGDASAVVGGAKVYAIGSPLGLQNTVSEGIVSNPARVDGGVTYIQTNAAISNGSSGGALIDKNGEVIGITSAGYDEGQNLNLALPMTYLNGYKANQITALSTLFPGTSQNTQDQQQKEVGGSRKEMAFSLLKDFVMENYQEYVEELGWYEYTVRQVKEDGTGYDSWALCYDINRGDLKMCVNDYYFSSHSFYYIFDISLDNSQSFGSYSFGIVTENDGIVDYASGKADVDIAEFSQSYNYEFYEYEGNSQDKDELIAASMHDDGLNFINFLFYTYLNDLGYYSTEDLGYMSYQKFQSKTDTEKEETTANVTYLPSVQSITVGVGKSTEMEIDFQSKGLPSDADFLIGTANKDIATAEWDYDDDTLPWTIIIKGISSGTTYLKIGNDYTEQYITIPITVTSSVSTPTDVMYSKFSTAKFPLRLYSNDGKIFLGKLTTNKYDSDSISNSYGTYGSKYSTTSIFNEYGTYGSKYSSESAFNDLASSPPIIVDSNGNFIAYLTSNTYKTNGITYYKLMVYLEQFKQ